MNPSRIAWLAATSIAFCASAAIAELSDDGVLAGVRWGDGIAQLKSKFDKLEPDLCAREDQGYYKSMNWSCEGLVRPQYTVAGLAFDVKFRMSAESYGLANLNLLGKVRGTQSGNGRKAFIESCSRIKAALDLRFGVANVSSDIATAEAVRRTMTWESTRKATAATLACVEVAGSDYGEIMINLEPMETWSKRM